MTPYTDEERDTLLQANAQLLRVQQEPGAYPASMHKAALRFSMATSGYKRGMSTLEEWLKEARRFLKT